MEGLALGTGSLITGGGDGDLAMIIAASLLGCSSCMLLGRVLGSGLTGLVARNAAVGETLRAGAAAPGGRLPSDMLGELGGDGDAIRIE